MENPLPRRQSAINTSMLQRKAGDCVTRITVLPKTKAKTPKIVNRMALPMKLKASKRKFEYCRAAALAMTMV
jgi:hypothetical protein